MSEARKTSPFFAIVLTETFSSEGSSQIGGALHLVAERWRSRLRVCGDESANQRSIVPICAKVQEVDGK
jgi:hypothetical protein